MKTAQQLRDEYGSQGEHPEYPVKEWKARVANSDMREGYWEWVAEQLKGRFPKDVNQTQG
jgi:hypothetical protein